MVDIKHSVGKGGKNDSGDVLTVQILLNKFIIPGFLGGPVLVQDGIAGKKTKAAIKAFQAVYLGFGAPDGKVDPGGKTIKALNGPLNQPQLGDPHESTLQSVIATLKSFSSSLDFEMDGYRVKASDYKSVASYFSWRRLQAFYDPSKGSNAEYVHGNDAGSGGYMLVGFPKAITATHKATVVHEGTHAVCDSWGNMMGNVQVEALAHLAQAIYYYDDTGRHFSISYAPTSDVLTTAVNIAIRMKSTGNRTVTSSEVSELYGRVIKLPSVPPGKVFFFDGF
jgi:peptidoglycan hydrolase-like protein with peptidoglycan-binding domain